MRLPLAPRARISAPMMRPPQMTSRFFGLMAGDYSVSAPDSQSARHRCWAARFTSYRSMQKEHEDHSDQSAAEGGQPEEPDLKRDVVTGHAGYNVANYKLVASRSGSYAGPPTPPEGHNHLDGPQPPIVGPGFF